MIHQTAYNTLTWHAPKCMKNTWEGENVHITQEELQTLILELSDCVRQHQPTYLLSDERNREFIYTVDTQAWVATTIATACIEAGLKKFAIIPSKDYIVELSTEQTVDEAGKLPFEIQYFQNEADAVAWLYA